MMSFGLYHFRGLREKFSCSDSITSFKDVLKYLRMVQVPTTIQLPT